MIRIASLFIAVIALAFSPHNALAQTKQRIDKAADLPRFTYKVDGKLEDIVRDEAKFRVFAQAIRRDTQSVLDRFDIAEKATQRQLLGVLLQLDLLEGRYDDGLARAQQIRELGEKPAERLLLALSSRAVMTVVKKTGERASADYRAQVGREIRSALNAMPYAVIENDIKSAKMSAELIGEALILGRVRDVLEPIAAKAGELSSDLAPSLVSSRFALTVTLPLKANLIETYSAYLAANQVQKADIWKARDVALPPGRNYQPVTVVVWDSGVDAALFPTHIQADGGRPAFIAFDKHSRNSAQPLVPIPDHLRPNLDQLQARSKGLSDMQSNVDSPQASEIKQLLSSLTPDRYKTVIEEINLIGNYQHGTHVAGIAMEGNPYARLANARIEFGHTLQPDPCPTDELVARGVTNIHDYVAFAKRIGARVVNMSWGGSVRGYEVVLEQCGIGKDAVERKAIARKYFDQQLVALTQAFRAAPDILFVTSAGNSANDATFNESYPSSIVLPNLITVGAVDKAGDEAPFTSYGPTVVVHANGYQVESFIPGGKRIAFSGTSMSSPQVANLAAKILAVKPTLKPPEVIALMVSTAEKTADGRRTLLHPAKALAEAGFR